jgi:hypothetical protein
MSGDAPEDSCRTAARRRSLEGLGAALFGPGVEPEFARLAEDEKPPFTEAELDAFDTKGLRAPDGAPRAH